MQAEPRSRVLPLEAVTLLQEGHLIEAIKVLRQTEQLDLREAKQRVDAYLNAEPLLKAQLELQQRARRRQFFFWFLIVDVALVAALIYWLRAGSHT